MLRFEVATFATGSAVAFVGAAANITLSLLNPGNQYASLFDQYRIDVVEAWIDNNFPRTTGGTTLITSAVDTDDSNVPTTFTSVDDRQGSLLSNGVVGHYHKWVPHMAVACYSGAFTSFASQCAEWIDVASPGVQHYGIKFGIAAGQTNVYSLSIRALVSFRGSNIN